MMTKRYHPEAGFTLIEIMVAVGILSIISLILWQSTAVIMQAKVRYEEEDIRTHEALLALTRMADDLSMAYLYQNKAHLGVTGAGEVLSEISFVGKDNGGQDTMNFSSMSHLRYIRDSKETERAEIGYFLKDAVFDEGAGWNLMKRVQSPPDNKPDEGGSEYVVLENVKELTLQYYDADKEDWRSEWDSTSLDYKKKLPRAVEITLVIPDPVNPEETRTFTTTTLLELAPGPNDF